MNREQKIVNERQSEPLAEFAEARTVPYEDLPEYLTPAELQAYLSLSRNTVYELLRQNKIPHVRFGRLIRIPKTVLNMNSRVS